MGKAPVLDTQQEGDDIERSIGKKEMLYALQSTLENAQDGKILAVEYHLKLVTPTFEHQFGCMTDGIVTAHDTVMLVEKLGGIFEAVEVGSTNEQGYFFELMTPNFYYTSGSYHPWEQLETTLLALCTTFQSESGDISLLKNNMSSLLTLLASYNLEVPAIPDFGQAPQPPQNGIRELKNNINSQCKAPRQTKKIKRKSRHMLKKRSVAGNRSYIRIIKLCMAFCAQSMLAGAFPVNTEPDSPLTLTAGSDGVIPFTCRNEQQSARKYYTVKFEKRDRPFYVDGTLYPDGLMSPDQAERFRVEYSEEGSAMSVEINIASVSLEDQGTYIVILIIQGETSENHLMKRDVLIFIPPGPAACFLFPSESLKKFYELHCHSKPGNGNSTLTCFQNGAKRPYQIDGVNTQIVYRRIFWLMDIDIPVSCCSHDIKEIDTIAQTSCDQYSYPRIEPENSPISPGNKTANKTVHISTTKPLSVEEEKEQPFPDTTYSGCGRNVDWSAVMLPLIAFFTYMCICNP